MQDEDQKDVMERGQDIEEGKNVTKHKAFSPFISEGLNAAEMHSKLVRRWGSIARGWAALPAGFDETSLAGLGVRKIPHSKALGARTDGPVLLSS